jgi:TM2 domain-containing membrane protein YozV
MKKLFMLFSLLVLVSAVSFGNSNQYRVNDSQIEAMFAQAQQVSLPATLDAQDFDANSPINPSEFKKSSKDPWIAWALCWVVGGFGVHRLYLGTNPWVAVGYLCTGGGICGIVWTVDWVVLLIGAINDDIGDYVDNRAFFMWM